MAEAASDRQNHPSPCSSIASLDSLELTSVDEDTSDEERAKEDHLPLLQEGLTLLSVNEDAVDSLKSEVKFDHRQCLFCKYKSVHFDTSLEHMLKKHGLSIPDRPHLVVDLETLVEYFHLVIFVYFECLYCGSQRNSAQAAQQHMMGKGHCKIDILSEDSEFKDFYDFDSISPDNNDDSTNESYPGYSDATVIDHSLRLPSGKILSRRTEGKPRHQQNRARTAKIRESLPTSQPTSLGTSLPEPDSDPLDKTSQATSRKITKRESFFHNQLATMRAEDRKSLMHLSASQQRAVISKGKKQVEQARKAENELLLKIQLKANR